MAASQLSRSATVSRRRTGGGHGLTTALWQVARDELPYPIIGVSMLGPSSVSPFDPANRSYTMLECSPLYIGQPRVQELLYSSKKKPRHFSRRTVGGFIEPFAFGGAGPTTGLAAGAPRVSLSCVDIGRKKAQ